MKKPKQAAAPSPLQAGKLEEIDLLRLQVACNNVDAAKRARDAVMVAILTKYTGDPAGKIGVNANDGTITRS